MAYGWSPGRVSAFEVGVVVDPVEIAKAGAELTAPAGYSAYVLLRAANEMHTHNLRELAKQDGYAGRG